MKQNPSFHSMAKNDVPVDPKSGFCSSDCVFYSTRKPLDLPNDEFMDVTTFVSTRNHSGKIALIDAATGEEISYAQLWQAVNSLAGSLSDLGIKQGHVVLLLSPNSIHFPIICLAVMSVGAIITTTNPLNTPSEISKQAGDSKAILAFTVPELIGKLAGIQLPVVLIGAEANHIPNLGRLKLVSSLQQLMERKTPHTHQTYQPRTRTRVRQHDTATLLYSSGTTGASKGVISSHRNLIASILTVMTRFKGHHTFLCTVPMFHIYGLAAFATGLLGSGSTIVILSKFEMEEMLWAIQRYRVSYFPLVPPILTAMANNPDLVRKYDLSSLQTVLSGGAPLSKEVIEGFLARFTGITILQGYGLTESAGVGASTDSQEESMHYGTAGLLSPNMEAQIVDPDTGEALPVNRKGELWLRGPSVMKGYFSNPEATASTLDSDGWLRTGDLCYIDDGGYIFVVDRLKELIKYKGYQVAPAELEALLLTHPEIADAAVIPYPDKEAGQYPMAYVARKAGSNLSESQVMEFVAAQVAPYKKIKRVAFVNGIPKNPSGKILRKDLIKLAASKL